MHVMAQMCALQNLNREMLEDHLSGKIEPLEKFPLSDGISESLLLQLLTKILQFILT